MGIRQQESCRKWFKELKILPLQSLYIYSTLLYIHKNKRQFSTLGINHSYETRNRHLLLTNKYRLQRSAKNSLDLNLYNHLSEDIKVLPFHKFKTALKNILLTHCFYTVKEFYSMNLLINSACLK